MTKSATVAELQRAGVAVEPGEAVAIAQQLIATLCDGGSLDVLEPPFGPPTAETVVLHGDGTVTCRGCDATPAVSEIARLLRTMLPDGASRPAGALRYTIARALLEVDAPPFDSIDALSRALARFESGPREHSVMRVLRRLDAPRALVPLPVADRRRQPQTTMLRRALRDADAQLYLRAVAPTTIVVTTPPARQRSYTAPLACLAAGLLLVGAGEAMHGLRAVSAAPPPPPPLAAPAPLLPRPLALSPPAPAPAALAEASRPHAPVVRRAAAPRAKRAVSVSRARSDRARGHGAARGALDFLRFRWLRTVFARRDL